MYKIHIAMFIRNKATEVIESTALTLSLEPQNLAKGVEAFGNKISKAIENVIFGEFFTIAEVPENIFTILTIEEDWIIFSKDISVPLTSEAAREVRFISEDFAFEIAQRLSYEIMQSANFRNQRVSPSRVAKPKLR